MNSWLHRWPPSTPILRAMELDRCYLAALRILRHRWNSVVELRRKLRVKNFDRPSIDSAVARLTAEGWLDDERFAGALVRTRQHKRIGPRRIARELSAAGVSGEIAERVLGENSDREREHDDAVTLCQKRLSILERRHGAQFVKSAEGRNKLAAYLLKHGYDAALVREVIDEVRGSM
jgi:regulatory protein